MNAQEKHCSLCNGIGHNKRTCRVRHLSPYSNGNLPRNVSPPPSLTESGVGSSGSATSFDDVLRRLEKVETPVVDGSQMYTCEDLETLWELKNGENIEWGEGVDADVLATFAQEVHSHTGFVAFQRFFHQFTPETKEKFLKFYRARSVIPHSQKRLIYKTQNPTIANIPDGLVTKHIQDNYHHQGETLPLNLQMVFFQDRSNKVLSTYAETRGIPQELQSALVRTRNLTVLASLVENSETTSRTLEETHNLVKTMNPTSWKDEDLMETIQTGIVSHPNTPIHVLMEYFNNEELMGNTYINVRVLTNPNTPKRALQERYRRNVDRIKENHHWVGSFVRENFHILSTGAIDQSEVENFVNNNILNLSTNELQNLTNERYPYYAEIFLTNNFTPQQLTTFYHHFKGKDVDKFLLAILGNRNAPVKLAEDYNEYYETIRIPWGDTQQAKYYADQMIAHHTTKKH